MACDFKRESAIRDDGWIAWKLRATFDVKGQGKADFKFRRFPAVHCARWSEGNSINFRRLPDSFSWFPASTGRSLSLLPRRAGRCTITYSVAKGALQEWHN